MTKAVGLITEYNPFHNGHAYHIAKAKELTGADAVIAVMSGNFVQRGAPAIINKYDRAAMALSMGVDLVLELPAIYATGSAELFSSGAVSLLNSLGIVSHICFGSESGELTLLSEIASILLEEPKNYKTFLKEALKEGHSYPTASSIALSHCLPDRADLQHIISTPNNILGIEYLKALKRSHSHIKPLTIARIGSGYHESDIQKASNSPSSATAIRAACHTNIFTQQLAAHMPAEALSIFMAAKNISCPVFEQDFSSILHYKLLSSYASGFIKYADVSKSLSDRIINTVNSFDDFTSFCELLKTKELTYSRISRALIHIMLEISQEKTDQCKTLQYPVYARILGFNKNSGTLLSDIKKCSQLPVISKLADADKSLSPLQMSLLEEDIKISHIYEVVVSRKFKSSFHNEFQRKLIVIN